MPTRTSGSAWRERWEPSEITDHAQAELTEHCLRGGARHRRKIGAEQTAAVVESVKAASDIYRRRG